jgi:4-hydroxythreonine-4-phosphate dehydrogenase
MTSTQIPRLAVVLGDPAGIGPELIARLLAQEGVAQAAELLVIARRDEFLNGMRIAGCSSDFGETASLDTLRFTPGRPLLYDAWKDSAVEFRRCEATAEGGRYSLESLTIALDLTAQGATDAILFGPLNKASLHMAGMAHSDELHWFAEHLGYTGPFCEFNVMDDLWTSRVTSHVALKEVSALITTARVMEAIHLIDDSLKRSGVARPRIAVCGLNPHNGDNGSFGREEIDVIAPAVSQARTRGLSVDGPFPADTVFLKVTGERREYDAIVTMYHDQGQIAIKLLGFWRGVTVQGGLPIPIATPAHGTAFDIATRGVAKAGATLQAFRLACRMGAARRATRLA